MSSELHALRPGAEIDDTHPDFKGYDVFVNSVIHADVVRACAGRPGWVEKLLYEPLPSLVRRDGRMVTVDGSALPGPNAPVRVLKRPDGSRATERVGGNVRIEPKDWRR